MVSILDDFLYLFLCLGQAREKKVGDRDGDSSCSEKLSPHLEIPSIQVHTRYDSGDLKFSDCRCGLVNPPRKLVRLTSESESVRACDQ